jgi:acetyltransferase-like isoleucine patch superfamily enzyme
VKFTIIKLFHWKDFTFSVVERFSPNVVTEFNKGSNVVFEKSVRVHSGTKIKVRSGARLQIGSNVKINYDCMLICHDQIEIGEGTEFGPSVYLFDHDHDYRVGLKENRFINKPITIGKNCWIGANSVILKGTILGDNCVVGAGSVISGEYEENAVIVQKRVTTTMRI